ncbi:MAG: protein-glutamate O-methyltransferase CheR [Magnetococcales bacterium]|nr:protein-glutamate O-methyltransferase CheR [Magnetococcales bacterium]
MAITKEEFDLIRQFVHEHSGILVGDGKEYLVENRLNVILVKNKCDNFFQLYEKLKKDNGALCVEVIDAMTTNETLWFRDTSFFAALSNFVIPTLLEKALHKPKIRIWSAACSTGQEPYSVAMLLDQARSAMGKTAPPLDRFAILATDISPSVLSIATMGRYSQLAISRGMRPAFLERFFINRGSYYEVAPGIHDIVTFKQFNLKEDFKPLGSFDFILCRNVLIYFSNELKSEIYRKLYESLVRDGILSIGASESPRGYTTVFEQVMVEGAALYRPSTNAGLS